jgi:hypothetical protein
MTVAFNGLDATLLANRTSSRPAERAKRTLPLTIGSIRLRALYSSQPDSSRGREASTAVRGASAGSVASMPDSAVRK